MKHNNRDTTITRGTKTASSILQQGKTGIEHGENSFVEDDREVESELYSREARRTATTTHTKNCNASYHYIVCFAYGKYFEII